jgi:signal transduction histidine kinase
MPDGTLAPDEDLAPEQAADAADAGLVRRVRRNLVLWSGGTTLLVLIVLGAVLYAAVDRSLAASGLAQLDGRMRDIEASITGQRPPPGDDGPFGFIFGGGSSGTLALALTADDQLLKPPGFRVPPSLPDMEAVTAARETGRDVRTTELGTAPSTVPVRLLTEPITDRDGAIYTVQVIQDRTTEQRTLEVMLLVLIVGGLLVVVVASGFGAIYARRALVPIRMSLANQRVALRRQRDFAADASHELRTPLTVIRSSVEHLTRHRDRPVSEVGAALEDIDHEVRHMTSMVEDLLLLARSDSGAIELEHLPVDLGDVAADGASALATPAADRGVTVEVDPQPAMVVGDPARLRQLVMILVDNAIRHSPTGARVGVTVRATPAGQTLVVEDEGPGIRSQDLPHVFERFYRASGAPSGGTGLGLAIAAWIVERHGGRIEVANRTDRSGARFRVTMPVGGSPLRATTGPVPETH